MNVTLKDLVEAGAEVELTIPGEGRDGTVNMLLGNLAEQIVEMVPVVKVPDTEEPDPEVPLPPSDREAKHVPSKYRNLLFRETFAPGFEVTKMWDMPDRQAEAAFLDGFADWGTSLLYDNRDLAWAQAEPGAHVLTPNGISLRTIPMNWGKVPGWFVPDLPRRNYVMGGMLSTENNPFTMQPGMYFEAMVRMNRCPEAHHFAFWMLNKNGAWPPEVDIFERVHGEMNEGISFNYHWDTGNGKEDDFKAREDLQIDNKWVRFGVEITNKDLVIYVDGVEQYRVNHRGQLKDIYILGKWEVNNWWSTQRNNHNMKNFRDLSAGSEHFGDVEMAYWEVYG